MKLRDLCDFYRYAQLVYNDPEIATPEKLLSIKIIDNGEPLLDVGAQAPEILCVYVLKDMAPYLGEKIFVRSSIVKKLKNIASKLSVQIPGARLMLAYGYRHPDIQRIYFEQMQTKIHNLFIIPKILRYLNIKCSWINKKICFMANFFAADPQIAGHPTGGAVDLTIVIPDKTAALGFAEMDMGGLVDDIATATPSILPTFAKNISEHQKANRLLLRQLMMDEGFAPFNGEWWHFSFGDRSWAAFYKKESALFQELYFSYYDKLQ